MNLLNTAGTLTVTGISQSGADDDGEQHRALSTSGAISTTGAGLVSLIASGAETIGANITAIGGLANITLNAGGMINQTGGVMSGALLTTINSTGGQTLNGANAVGSFNATNATSGAINLVNTATTLMITGISEVAGGGVNVQNTGAIVLGGAVIAGAAGTVKLDALRNGHPYRQRSHYCGYHSASNHGG